MSGTDKVASASTNNTRRGDVRDGTWMVGARVFQMAFSFPVGFFNAWLLGPALLGALKVIETISGYAIRSDLGLTKAYAREIPILAGRGDQHGAYQVRSLVITESMASTVVVIVGLWVAYLAGWRMGGVLSTVGIMVLTSGLLLSSRVAMFLGKHLSAEGHFVFLSRSQVFLAVLGPLLTIPLVFFFRLHGVLLALILVHFAYVLLVQRFAPVRVVPMIDWAETKRLLRIGLSLFLLNFGGMVFWSIELLMLPVMMSLQATGLFGFALSPINTARTIPQSLHTVFFRNMALERGEKGKKDPAYLRRYLEAPLASYVLLSALCLGGAVLVYRQVIHCFLHQYTDSLPLMVMLAFGFMIYQSRVFGGFVLNLMDEFNTLLLIQATVIVVNVSVDIILIKRLGLWGAGIGASVSFALSGFLFTVLAARRVHEGGTLRGLVLFGKVLVASGYSVLFLYSLPSFLEAYLVPADARGAMLYIGHGAALLIELTAYTFWCTIGFVVVFWRENLWEQIRSAGRDLSAYMARLLFRFRRHAPVAVR